MKIARATLILMVAMLFPGVAFGGLPAMSEEAIFNPPPVRLIYPVTDKVSLAGKDYLEFKWWDDFGQTDHMEFRLFKGYDMLASDQILKEDVPARRSSLKVSASQFKEGQVYTWCLVRVALGGRKSDKTFQSFQVVKI